MLIDVIEKENPPFRLLLGSDVVKVVSNSLKDRLKEIQSWEAESIKTDYE